MGSLISTKQGATVMTKPKTTAPGQTFLPFDLYLSENT